MQGGDRVVGAGPRIHLRAERPGDVEDQPAAVVLVHRPVGPDAQRVARTFGVGVEDRYGLGIAVERFAVDEQRGVVGGGDDDGVVLPRLGAPRLGEIGTGLHEPPTVDTVEFGAERCREVETVEKLPMPRLYGERRGELRAVVIRLVALDGASQTVVEVLVGFLVVERTRIVETAARRVAVGATLPVAAEADGAGQSLVALTRIAGIGGGRQVVGVDIQRRAFCVTPPLPFESLSDGEEFAAHVGLEAGGEVATALAALDLDQSARQVAVFDRRDAPHDFDRFDVVGRDRTCIDAAIDVGVLLDRPVGGRILQVGIITYGDAVYLNLGTQCRRSVIGGARRVGFAQADLLRRSERGVGGAAAGDQLHEVGDARRLDVGDGFAADLRRRRGPFGFGGRHQHLADGHRIDVEPDSAAGQSGGKLQFALQKYVSHV